ncbi:hypothetical protein [Longimicrobium sp.]|uniref:hypothetical protein n=1 Tax=Longimicrobium sp. TaxID=2029185 RepID=UPI002C228787|nr:hypothetical protein [Longimicrobium sp.]HSU14519.1 hypothetical protein [Longimicrobium sp.]
MVTLAHSTSGEFGRPRTATAGARAALERAVDAAPSRIPPPRGWLRRLFARDRSARALIERYRLWPEIEYAYERMAQELGEVRVEMLAQDDDGEPYLALNFHTALRDVDELLDVEDLVRGELRARRRGKSLRRLSVLVHPDPSM